ncbi:hypothetical protein AC578_555 [Pseudocercospora eumusae]|uniref:Uncharacterized protein n=1 Tax=Pseudocercospora eumusae TaxID=321146 RepID=A0A139HYA7_9PEZI|nr:hypothetical protein AC578_555 [Pseudocercospora eumusae]
MDVFATYTAATSAYLAIQAVPLLLSPRLIVGMLANEAHTTTDVETYFGRALSLALLALSLVNLVLSGLLPVTSQLTETDVENPYSYPTALLTTAYHALSAFYLYTQVTYGFSFGFGSGLVASSTLFCFGIWVCVFGGEKARTSKTTGADKRTSNFPFTNAEVGRAQVMSLPVLSNSLTRIAIPELEREEEGKQKEVHRLEDEIAC